MLLSRVTVSSKWPRSLLEFFPDFLNYRFWQLVIQMRTLIILLCSLLSYCATKNNFLCLHFLFCFASRQLSATHTRSGQFWPIKNSKTFGNNSSRVRGHFEVTVNRLYLFLQLEMILPECVKYVSFWEVHHITCYTSVNCTCTSMQLLFLI